MFQSVLGMQSHYCITHHVVLLHPLLSSLLVFLLADIWVVLHNLGCLGMQDEFPIDVEKKETGLTHCRIISCHLRLCIGNLTSGMESGMCG